MSPKRIIFFLLIALALSAPSTALDMPVMPGDQAETFAKIFRFDRHLKGLAKLQMVVATPSTVDPDVESAVEAVRSAFGAVGVQSTSVPVADLAGALGADSVIYVLSQELARGTLDAASAAGALSITGDASLVESGMVAVGVEPRGGTTGIVINADRLADEGHAFTSDLLRLARIVRGRAAVPVAKAGGAGLIPPSLVGFRAPAYPPLARRLRVEGTAVVRVLVSATGQVEEVQLLEGVPRDAGINDGALAAARTARFEPGTRDGVPVQAWAVLRVPFKL